MFVSACFRTGATESDPRRRADATYKEPGEIMPAQLWLVRHGETEWSASGQHTGRTDIPLTLEGKLHARQIAGLLHGHSFALVLSSPLQRALETCRLAGFGEEAQLDENLLEWNYGNY
jgi:broad specificity phosphatase PhoE